MHACVLQSCISYRWYDFGFGQVPPPRIGMSTFLTLYWLPLSQAMEHGDHDVHSSRVQSRSQDPVLQGLPSLTALQPFPPFFGFVRIERVRSSTPPSQSLEHFDQPDHLDIKQSTGHLN